MATSRNDQGPRPQHERSAESSRRLVEAAIELIAEKGFDKATAAEIGIRAGYSREMVRHRYGTKEELLEALMETEYRPRLLRAPAPDRPGLEQALDHLDIRAATSANPEMLRAFFVLCFESVGPIPYLIPWMKRWFADYREAITTALRVGIDDGTVRADLDVDRAARNAITFGAGLGFEWVLELSDAEFYDEYKDWLGTLRAHWMPLDPPTTCVCPHN